MTLVAPGASIAPRNASLAAVPFTATPAWTEVEIALARFLSATPGKGFVGVIGAFGAEKQ